VYCIFSSRTSSRVSPWEPAVTPDQSGALATLARQTGGAVILWVVAVGLVALALWRIAEAIVGSKPGERSGGGQDDDTPAWKRVKSLGLAIVNFAIAVSAARFRWVAVNKVLSKTQA
jgi:hypothetical protein